MSVCRVIHVAIILIVTLLQCPDRVCSISGPGRQSRLTEEGFAYEPVSNVHLFFYTTGLEYEAQHAEVSLTHYVAYAYHTTGKFANQTVTY